MTRRYLIEHWEELSPAEILEFTWHYHQLIGRRRRLFGRVVLLVKLLSFAGLLLSPFHISPKRSRI